MATNGNTNHQEQWRESGGAPSDAPSTSNAADSTPSKDEVGWYFVQQYYTTLSKNPDKLHLFYNKRSQFVQGLEAELSPVAVGRQAISERIKELDFHDCKVRVSNVDSQASYDNIVIQVIGEICNKSGEPKKFVQTFVLAQQPAGYFLLNDILRYVNEGEEEATEGAVSESAPAVEMEAPQEPAAATASASAVAAPEPEKAQVEEPAENSPATLDAEVVDKKLEEASSTAKDTPSTTAAETPVEAAPAVEEAPSKAEANETSADPEKTAQEIAEEDAKKPELPKDPSPTPAPSRAPAPEPEKPKGPPKPMSWASRAAAAVGVPVKPVVPLPKAAPAAAAPTQQRSSAAAASPAQPKPSAAPAQPSENAAQAADKDAASEWRTAGADSKRQSRQQSTSTPLAEKEGTLAYVKFVTEKVKEDDLRAALGSYGEMVYFDINRSKNCAFVEYSAAGGYQAAIGASPITVNGENIVVEPRRPKAGAYGGANYNQNRGSISGRGRGFEGQRSGSQGGGRGGYPSRGRGGAPRGRGGPQATNA